MIRVVDSSVVVAALVDSGPGGGWAEEIVRGEPMVAPHIMPAEVANVLRRSAVAGLISDEIASQAYEDLRALRIDLYPWAPFASRVWELRQNMTAYDAWYVALAEGVGADLATLDMRLARASGSKCTFLTPP